MTTKRRNLFLGLTLVCFFGLIAIFVVDGYMGIYDTTYITTGEREQKIEADTWLKSDSFRSSGINWGEKAFFRYEVVNRQFSSYSVDIQVSVWRMQEKVLDVLLESITVDLLDKGKLEWVIDSAELLPENTSPEQSYEFTVIIKRGESERRIIMHINPAYPVRLVPPLPR